MTTTAGTSSSFRNPRFATRLSSPKSIRNGFTLIELICVLIILGIVTAVVTPQLRFFTAGRAIGNTANQILAMTHAAHDNAISEAKTYRLNYDVSGKSLWLTRQDGSTYAAAPGEFGDKLTMSTGLSIDADFAKQDDGVYVAFAPTGRTTPGTITLSDLNGSQTRIACTSATELFRILAPNEVVVTK